MNNKPITVEQLNKLWALPKQNKPTFSMEKIKKKLREFYDAHEATRISSPENKALFPRIHQSVQSTAWELIKYYLRNWGKGNATNYELRITHSYLKQALNNSCCIATLKNHINKLLAMSDGFIKAKFRGGLRINEQNTPCIVLVLNKNVLIFNDERHNQALAQEEIAAEEKRLFEADRIRKENKAAQEFFILQERLQREKESRIRTPTSIGTVLMSAFSVFQKWE
jgi:hypothetical protein